MASAVSADRVRVQVFVKRDEKKSGSPALAPWAHILNIGCEPASRRTILEKRSVESTHTILVTYCKMAHIAGTHDETPMCV